MVKGIIDFVNGEYFLSIARCSTYQKQLQKKSHHPNYVHAYTHTHTQDIQLSSVSD